MGGMVFIDMIDDGSFHSVQLEESGAHHLGLGVRKVLEGSSGAIVFEWCVNNECMVT